MTYDNKIHELDTSLHSSLAEYDKVVSNRLSFKSTGINRLVEIQSITR